MDYTKYVNPLPYSKTDKVSRDAYNKKVAELHSLFLHDALTELELLGHPKANLLFEKAWELGHSCGYLEVFCYMSDLADLIK